MYILTDNDSIDASTMQLLTTACPTIGCREIVHFLTDNDSIGEAVCKRAEALNAAAVVMAKHQRGAIAEFFLGSGAQANGGKEERWAGCHVPGLRGVSVAAALALHYAPASLPCSCKCPPLLISLPHPAPCRSHQVLHAPLQAAAGGAPLIMAAAQRAAAQHVRLLCTLPHAPADPASSARQTAPPAICSADLSALSPYIVCPPIDCRPLDASS